MDPAIEKLRKLLALSRQGVGGEKDNAGKLLLKMLEKTGITLEEIDDERREMVWFNPGRGPHNKKLLHQVAFAVVGGSRSFYTNRSRPGKVGIEVTKVERLEIEFRFSIYRKAFKKELDLALNAFIQVNKIFPDGPEAEPDEDAPPPDPEEMKRLLRRMKAIDRTEIRKALT